MVTGVVNVICFNYTGRLTPDDILNQAQKQTVDYYVVVVVVMSWIRFFSYFLLIRPVSKLLMTLIRMLWDTISFMFIMICYLLISSSVFTTLFQGPAPEFYGSMTLSLRTMFDYTLGNYDREDLERNNYSHSLLLIVHLIISNIFLLNYLIAILSTVYATMRVVGEFKYQASRYSFIEKHQIAWREGKGKEQFVIYPAPMNLITIFLIPFAVNTKGEKYGEVFSKCMYWIENTVIGGLFWGWMIILYPIVYVKVWVNLLKILNWKRFIWIGPLWVLIGPFILIWFVIRDLLHFMRIC